MPAGCEKIKISSSGITGVDGDYSFDEATQTWINDEDVEWTVEKAYWAADALGAGSPAAAGTYWTVNFKGTTQPPGAVAMQRLIYPTLLDSTDFPGDDASNVSRTGVNDMNSGLFPYYPNISNNRGFVQYKTYDGSAPPVLQGTHNLFENSDPAGWGNPTTVGTDHIMRAACHRFMSLKEYYFPWVPTPIGHALDPTKYVVTELGGAFGTEVSMVRRWKQQGVGGADLTPTGTPYGDEFDWSTEHAGTIRNYHVTPEPLYDLHANRPFNFLSFANISAADVATALTAAFDNGSNIWGNTSGDYIKAGLVSSWGIALGIGPSVTTDCPDEGTWPGGLEVEHLPDSPTNFAAAYGERPSNPGQFTATQSEFPDPPTNFQGSHITVPEWAPWGNHANFAAKLSTQAATINITSPADGTGVNVGDNVTIQWEHTNWDIGSDPTDDGHVHWTITAGFGSVNMQMHTAPVNLGAQSSVHPAKTFVIWLVDKDHNSIGVWDSITFYVSDPNSVPPPNPTNFQGTFDSGSTVPDAPTLFEGHTLPSNPTNFQGVHSNVPPDLLELDVTPMVTSFPACSDPAWEPAYRVLCGGIELNQLATYVIRDSDEADVTAEGWRNVPGNYTIELCVTSNCPQIDPPTNFSGDYVDIPDGGDEGCPPRCPPPDDDLPIPNDPSPPTDDSGDHSGDGTVTAVFYYDT